MHRMARKIKNYGVKKVFVLIFIRSYLGVKRFIYLYLLSDNKPGLYSRSIFQPTQFTGKGRISVGRNSTIGVWPSPQLLSGYAYLEARGKDSIITIGERTSINNSAIIIADKTTISIGSDCLIGQCVQIFDSDFHGLELENRNNGLYKCLPVSIDDNVFIGANATILKGVSVGEGAVIAAGSVVIRDVEPFSVVAGIPAKKIRSL